LHKKVKIAAETDYIYTPLAHRLGLYKIKTEFQDICLRISEPETYQEIANKLAESKEERSKYIGQLIKPLEEELKSLNIKYRVTGRSKAISSIYNKLKSKKVSFEEIYDIFAVRIIIDVPPNKEKSMCWQVYSIITDVYKPIPERLKDWVTTPKSNGYESLHTTVIGPRGRFVEVQIRSERMDEIAEKGFAAHWKYKGIKSENNVYDYWLNNIRELLDSQHNNALEFLNDFKTNLFSEEVYVFSPKGDMMMLPKGATALDFAFHIHSDVGYHATAIKVNNKLVPMGYKLANGDQIFVTTNKSQRPTESWLKMVVTGKAKSKIRSSMKEEKRKQGELGHEALERKLNNMKLNFEDNVDFLVKHYQFQSRPDLYYAYAVGDLKVTDLNQFDIELGKFKVKAELKEEILTPESKKKRVPFDNKSKLYINGEPASNYSYSLATCCNPLQGDSIFAYTTANNVTKIHRINCPNATHILANYGYRVLTAEWDSSMTGQFIVDLEITGVDTGVGVIQKLTNEISNNLNVNIRSFSISGDEGYFVGKVGLVVMNKNQLHQIVKAIEKLDGISNVTRLDKSSK
jgi:GTP pyrophosphokinase